MYSKFLLFFFIKNKNKYIKNKYIKNKYIKYYYINE